MALAAGLSPRPRILFAAALTLLLVGALVRWSLPCAPAAGPRRDGVRRGRHNRLSGHTPGDGQCAAQYQGVCTLRAAVQELEAQGGGEIQLPPGVFNLTIAGDVAGDGVNPPKSEVDLAKPEPSDRSAQGDLDISKAIEIRVRARGAPSSMA